MTFKYFRPLDLAKTSSTVISKRAFVFMKILKSKGLEKYNMFQRRHKICSTENKIIC
jgi:hypothetical protein